jgi:diacylglycerol kinase family enzyme
MDESRRTLVIINHAAARARRAWPGILYALKRAGIRFDAHETRHAGDATTRTRAALQDGYEIIAVVGGDGTLSEVAEGFFDLPEVGKGSADNLSVETGGEFPVSINLPRVINGEAALAILPSGTGNDFARGLLGRRASIEEWTNNLIAHSRRDAQSRTRTVDVLHGKTNGGAHEFICLNVATLGIGAEVAAGVAAQKGLTRRLPGEARFVSAALAALLAWRERPVRASLDDGTVIERPMNLLAVANGIYAGGGMMFAPDARLDDGMMNVLLAHNLSRAAILRELPRIRRGGHLSNPRVRAIKTTRVIIETIAPQDALPVEADGNVRGHTPAEFRIIPSALKVVLPE